MDDFDGIADQVIARTAATPQEWPLMDGGADDEWENHVTQSMMVLSEIYDPAGVAVYLSSPNKMLDDKRPCDLIRDRDVDGLRRLHTIVENLADGAFL